jgi:hypothetical protein
MAGRKQLRKLQFTKETTPGTAITVATAIWRGEGGSLLDGREVVFPPEWIGIFSGADRSHIAKITAALSIAECPATFEQLPYLFGNMYGGPLVGVTDGTGSTGFKYVTNVPTTAAPTNNAHTIQGGDDFEAEYITYGKVTKATLKGAAGGDVRMSGEAIGQQVLRLSTGLTAGVAIPTVEDALFGKSKLYYDPIAGPFGTTQVVNQFLGFEVTFEGMWIPKFTGDGNLYWSFALFVNKKVTGKVTVEHDTIAGGAAVGSFKFDWRAQNSKALRIDVIGSTYATPGTGTVFTGGTRGIRLDLPIKWTKVPPLADMNENDVITAEFTCEYNATAAHAGIITVCNEIATLP